MARWIVSDGILAFLAAVTAVRRRGFASGSPPPIRAAEVNSRMSLVNVLPRRASTTAFLCLIEAHLECPDILLSFPRHASPSRQAQNALADDVFLNFRRPGIDRFRPTPQKAEL